MPQDEHAPRRRLQNPVKWLLSKDSEGPEDVPRREMLFYTLGLAGQNMVWSMAGGDWFFHFCTNVLMIPSETVGNLTSAVTVFDAANDPFAGALIDNFRFKDGRKILPWIKLTSPLVAILSFLLFINWGFSSIGQAVAMVAVVYVLWDIAYSFQDTAIWGITATISSCAAQRARSAQWGDIGSMLGTMLPSLLLPMLADGGAFGLNQQQVYLMFSLLMCLGGGFLSLFAVKTKERVLSAPPKNESRSGIGEMLYNIGQLRYNHVLLLCLASEFLRYCTPYINQAYIYQQLSYNVGSKVIHATVLVTLLSTVTGLPGTFAKLWATKISDKVGGPKNVMLIAAITNAVVYLLQFSVGIKTPLALVFVYLLEGLRYLPDSINGIAMRSMISDSVEYVEWKTGYRTEGMTMSMRNFTSKAAQAVRRLIQGKCLTWLQYDADLVKINVQQNAHFHKWAWATNRVGLAAGLFLGLIPLLLIRYPNALKRQVESDMINRRALREGDASSFSEEKEAKRL